MLVTALVPHVGYERAAGIALAAHRGGVSLRESATGTSGGVQPEVFDRWVRPAEMARPHASAPASSPGRLCH